jgi:hypothetical protein
MAYDFEGQEKKNLPAGKFFWLFFEFHKFEGEMDIYKSKNSPPQNNG